MYARLKGITLPLQLQVPDTDTNFSSEMEKHTDVSFKRRNQLKGAEPFSFNQITTPFPFLISLYIYTLYHTHTHVYIYDYIYLHNIIKTSKSRIVLRPKPKKPWVTHGSPVGISLQGSCIRLPPRNQQSLSEIHILRWGCGRIPILEDAGSNPED